MGVYDEVPQLTLRQRREVVYATMSRIGATVTLDEVNAELARLRQQRLISGQVFRLSYRHVFGRSRTETLAAPPPRAEPAPEPPAPVGRNGDEGHAASPVAPDRHNGVGTDACRQVGTDARPQAGELPPALTLVLRQLRAAPTGAVGSADLAALEDLCRLAAVVEEVGGPARARALLDLYCLLRAPDGGADDNHTTNGEGL